VGAEAQPAALAIHDATQRVLETTAETAQQLVPSPPAVPATTTTTSTTSNT
jgi:hypothetical protein